MQTNDQTPHAIMFSQQIVKLLVGTVSRIASLVSGGELSACDLRLKPGEFQASAEKHLPKRLTLGTSKIETRSPVWRLGGSTSLGLRVLTSQLLPVKELGLRSLSEFVVLALRLRTAEVPWAEAEGGCASQLQTLLRVTGGRLKASSLKRCTFLICYSQASSVFYTELRLKIRHSTSPRADEYLDRTSREDGRPAPAHIFRRIVTAHTLRAFDLSAYG
ncbi:uncharacterized protein BDR25DRAFT_359894 [Lindgomyces ingoldianus]|uniref:Uncharacterized protein n=1 Tax=Lindgomyces ingoldianus TaxID=673940 RepID=A0ACB6QGI0_9PLEO|nr:uncharacterized protein BDR25DRAFT_359894 [Lindgomyces ingoldianus]KAF2466099.1 hypothetical protein BDR25DRAFT_359894 [Lindgomyces ingoldianus]